MGPTENELSRNSFAASKIQDDMLPSMILNSLGETGNSMVDYNGEWQIKSFVTQDRWYTINVNNNLTQDCTCPNFLSRQISCEVGEIVEERRVVEHRDAHVFDRIATYSTTMHHCFEDLQTLKTIPDLDQTDAKEIERALAHAVQLIDKYRSKNPSYFRNLKTQR
ncbi:hypothetical protein PHYBLDRAFT_161787 [Phycomyces blakesleeanus NRRL 1555(-)]|uniref:SWIM-type domain-containing protein n=1 Tax=Phycomyces blakesleeanus (strain ATCC 8743b / DSM 1359 / FGSC 10004 / NBRC 33097 / NRRL 1555) TaxID=763407 RepID=A0A162Q987_PHYB8|nr:hypothetical protein PHYBLDRAFT_161787 [Phycomyces blakesleeanus NRRL 1555(-)]OAD81156.1 hypothetical protein PHYBLDRAFT_161787 [Phycomyces blakesleeanus NRRL 1555(-)]|eukprot:XP_018299196.1 hypothetical protein PHYBLDRAFT_161787 [Phycomyces blakesleeanus NRRL 1555(-)]